MWHLVKTNKNLHWLSLGVFTENFSGKVSAVSKLLAFRLKIVFSQQAFLQENPPVKKHLRMWNSQRASPVILFPFFIFASILYNLQAVCMRWETICPRARAHEILGCFLSFSWESWSLKSNSQRKQFASKSSSLAWSDLTQSTFNKFSWFILSREMVNITPGLFRRQPDDRHWDWSYPLPLTAG